MKAVFPADCARRFPGHLQNSFWPGQSAMRAVLWLILFCAALGAIGAERSGSTFTPGTLGDFGVAVVSTNPGLYLRNDMFYYQGDDARTMRNGQINVDLDQSTWVESLKLILVPGWTVLGARYAAGVNLGLVSAHVQSDVLQPDPSGKIQAQYVAGDYIYACIATRL